MYGGAGDDQLNGAPGFGRDRLFGGSGNDTVLADFKDVLIDPAACETFIRRARQPKDETAELKHQNR